MRAPLLIAAGLFATNLVLVVRARRDESPVSRHVRELSRVIESDHPPIVTSGPRFEDARRLAWLRAARRAGFRVTDCPHYDPLATLDADVDPAPGVEHVIGNRHDGIAMYAHGGELLAYGEPIGCADAFDGDQSLSISLDSKLILRTRTVNHSGEHLNARIVERREDTLVTLLDEVDLGGRRGDGTWRWEAEGKLYIDGDSAEVKMHGRSWGSFSRNWEPVDTHCTYDLVTRSSSCRTRAAGQTSRPE